MIKTTRLSQNNLVLNWLKSGRTLTPDQAFAKKVGGRKIQRLASRVYDLNKNYEIVNINKKTDFGQQAVYKMSDRCIKKLIKLKK